MTALTTTHIKCDRCGILSPPEALDAEDLRKYMATTRGWLSG